MPQGLIQERDKKVVEGSVYDEAKAGESLIILKGISPVGQCKTPQPWMRKQAS